MSSGPEVTAFDKCNDLPKDSGTAVGEGVSGIAPSSFTRLGVGFLRCNWPWSRTSRGRRPSPARG
jgi:hypothetical protein